jgi:hypothetical protein
VPDTRHPAAAATPLDALLRRLARSPDGLVRGWAAWLRRGETASGKAPGTDSESSDIQVSARGPAGP